MCAAFNISARAQVPLDTIFNDATSHYHLPGLAIGVVENGKVVYVRTGGELATGSGQPITPDTLFKIASNTKAMTTGVLARLVDAGKLRWDDPVVKYLPAFRMYDPWVTQQMQVRDLLIHNSGLGAGAGDLMLWPEPNMFTRADVIAGLAYLKPAYSFRSRYAYDNTLYIVAGEVAAAAADVPYEELVRRELFGPLGMTRCRVGAWRRDEAGNVAQPHGRRDGGNAVVNADDETIPNVPMMAAGGIRCSLNDMLTWVRMWLDPKHAGLVAGKPWLSAEQREAVWTAQTPMPLTQRMRDWDGSHYSAYGYGWRLTDVDGTQKVSHTGTLSGMYSA
ncbi:MAG: serine hydrolase domain-containing protein, partial [Luteimonas sp.]